MKKLFSVLLIFLIIAALIPLGVFAADDTVTLKTPEDLIALSKKCVSDTWSKGKTVVLANDIDLSGSDYSPIPLFSGKFSGGGHTVSGFSFDREGTVTGFFRRITGSGSVENLNIKGSVHAGDSSSTVGGFVGENQGVIKNCSFSGDVSGYESVGGFCGVNALQGVIEKVTVDGSVSGQHRTGGVSGENKGAIRSCSNRSEVNKDVTDEISPEASAPDLTKLNLSLSAEELVDITDVGGIAGLSSGVLRKCDNKGVVGHRYVGYNIGGIAGRVSGHIDSCGNSGKVYGRKDVGGIAGQTAPDTSWDFSTEKLSDLKAKLESLRGSIQSLTSDISSYSSALSQDLSSVSSSLSGANTALNSIADDAVSFVNENIGVINELSSRITQTISDFQPAFSEAEGFLNGLPEIFEDLTQLLDGLSETSEITGEAYEGIKSDIKTASDSVDKVRTSVSGVKEKLSAFLSSPDLATAAGLLSAISGAVTTVRTETKTAKTASGDIVTQLTGVADHHGDITSALELASQISENIDSSMTALGGVGEQLNSAYDALSGYESLSFSPFNEEGSARSDLFSSISSAYTAFQSAAGRLNGTSVEEDVNAVSNDFIDIIKLMLESVSGVSTSSAQVSDISSGSSDRTDGVIKNCRNTGQITAESNGGGITGAVSVDVSFDLEDEFHISSLLTGGMKYLIFARIEKCENSAPVSVKKNAAGGIAGRMDYGTVSGCRSGGEITANGDYAGGIAGMSEGSISGCYARVNLSAEKYAGGIAGKGKDISDCLCMPVIKSDGACIGSVAGDAGGKISGNCYAQSDLGGVNGFSYKGQAELVSYEKLMKLSKNAPLFDTVTVTFICDDEQTEVVTVPFGGSVEKLPELPDKDGKHWRWDDFDNTAIYGSLTVEGSYQSPVSVLSSGEDTPMFLVEGDFTDKQELDVISSLAATPDETKRLYTLSVSGCGEELKVRMLSKADGELCIKDENGAFNKTSYTRDGSYILFPLKSGGSFTFSEGKPPVWLYILIGVIAAAVLITGAVLIIRSRRKKKKITSEDQ